MKLIFLACVACVMSVPSPDVIIDGVRHRTQILYKNLSNPHLLRLDDISEMLYFREKKDTFVVGRLDLNTSEIQYIDGFSDANEMTVDQATQTIYIGTTEGLYKYNYSNNKTELVGLAGVNVWNAYFVGALYYTVGYTETVYTFSDEKFTKYVQLDNKVDRLLIYNEDITYFSNNTVVYRQKNGKKAVVLYNGDYVKDLITDNSGKVYFFTQNAIYQISNERDMVRKVATFDNLRGMVFNNKNNIIYCDNSTIYLLKPVSEITEIKEELEYIYLKLDNLERTIRINSYNIDNKMNTINGLETKLETKIGNLEKNIKILEQQLHRTISTGCSPQTVHLDLRNVPISMDDAQEEQATTTSSRCS